MADFKWTCRAGIFCDGEDGVVHEAFCSGVRNVSGCCGYRSSAYDADDQDDGLTEHRSAYDGAVSF